jgi:hypothetical protein
MGCGRRWKVRRSAGEPASSIPHLRSEMWGTQRFVAGGVATMIGVREVSADYDYGCSDR